MDRTTTNQLVALQRRLAAWREAHGGRAHRGAPIPDELWAEATRIAARVGVGATARATRLHAGRLRERVHASAAETGSATLTTTFVELLARSSREHIVGAPRRRTGAARWDVRYHILGESSSRSASSSQAIVSFRQDCGSCLMA